VAKLIIQGGLREILVSLQKQVPKGAGSVLAALKAAEKAVAGTASLSGFVLSVGVPQEAPKPKPKPQDEE